MNPVTYDDLPPEDDHYAPVTQLHPHANTQAEASLISLVLDEPSTAPDLLDRVDPEDFYEPRHETLWHALGHVLADGLLPDHPALLEQLRRTGDIAKVRLENYTLSTTGAVPSQRDWYADTIRNAAIVRRATTSLTQAQQQLQTATTPAQVGDALGGAMDSLDHGLKTLWSEGPTTTSHHTDLTWLNTGQTPLVPAPDYIRQTNGHAIFYAGRVNGIFGDPEAAKSWLAMIGVVEALTAGQRAAYIDVDHNGAQIITERLLLLGAQPHHLSNPDHFQLHEPEDGPALRDTIRALITWQPAYAVLDSIGEMMPMLGIKSVDNDELSGALRTIATSLANTGTCVVTVDHLPKGTESRATGFAIGGTAKKRAIDGSYIHAEARTPPAPGHVGKITLRIEKDRPGRLREHAQGKYLGTLTIDSTNTGITTISIGQDSPITDTGVFRPTGLMEAVSRFVEENDQATFNDITETVTGKEKTIRAALKCLVNEGFLSTMRGPRNSTLHHSIALYRETEDDQI
ncbi:MAG: RecA recombination protein [Aeromicrobium sp.]|nr:RecA recombination protein [Aeromicrobium sp.]